MTLAVKHFLKLLLPLVLFSCSANDELSIFQGEAYGTTWQVKFYETETKVNKDYLLKTIQQELKRIDSIFSLYDENSTISKVNSGAWPSWTFYPGQEDYEKLSDISKRIKEKSNGTFEVYFDGKWDFNSIAKGYAVDKVSEILRLNNLQNFMVEIGGEIRFEGKKLDSSWKFAVINPTLEKKLYGEFFVPESLSVATSGNYRNPGHIINPINKVAVESDLLSVSVIDRLSTAKADAWATALYASENDWLKKANNEKIAAFFIYKDTNDIKSISSEKWLELIN